MTNSKEKECGCLTHQGPHWLHMDHFAKKQNLTRLLAVAVNLTEGGSIKESLRFMEEFMHAEKRRLDEKVHSMKEGEEYPYSLLGDVEDLQALEMAMLNKLGEDCQIHKELWLQRLREEQERVQIEQGVLL